MRLVCLGILAALAGIVACSESMTGPLLEVGGDWAFADSVSADFGACTAKGIATFDQTGSSFTGVIDATEGVCNWEDGGSNDNSGAVSLSAGMVTDSLVTFTAGICEFQSTSITSDRIEGDEVCAVMALGRTFDLVGSFTLIRP